jgi:hypothetical protein
MFSTTCDSASITSIVKMAAFKFYLQLGKQQGSVGGDDTLFLVKNFLVKKEV